MSEQLRVTHVIPSMDMSMGGPPVAVAGWSRGLEQIGDSSVVVTTSLAGPARWRMGRVGSTAIRLPAGHETMDIRVVPATEPLRFAFSRRLNNVLEETTRNSDLVHVHMLYLYPTFAACRVARRVGVPYVVSPHGALDPYILRHGRFQKQLSDVLWQRRALEAAGAIFATTEAEGLLMEPVRLSPPIVVVPIGLDLAAFVVAAEGRREPTIPVIVNHGRLAPKKSLDMLVDALSIVRRTGAAARLRLIGPDLEGVGANLLARANRLGIASSVDVCGPMYGESLARAVADATVWVLPSATENFGIAVVEAMAAGTPVVVSEEVNLADSAHAAGACRITPREPGALARTIQDLLVADDDRAALSIAGRAFAAGFDMMDAATRLHAAYETVIGHAQPRR